MSGPLPIVTYLLGGWDLSACADLLLQGVIFAQTAHYFALYHSDLLALRLFVFGLLLLTTLKSMQTIALLWAQNVTHFTDIRAASTLFMTSWLQKSNLVFGAFISFYIQIFMCQRLWALCKNVYIVVILMTIFTFSLIAAFMAISLTTTDGAVVRPTWIACHFGVVFLGDLLLCGSMAYSLLKHLKQVLPKTAGLLNSILKITIQSAMPGAICAMVTLISSQIGDKSNPARLATLVSMVFSGMLPKLYAISALWTLNSRRTILLSHSTDTSSTEYQSGGRRSGVSGGRGVELGRFSKVQSIQVRTQVQTTRHTDDDACDHDLKPPGIAGENSV